ncbi:MAG: hypothetical protein M5U28_22715 [Sandaracinaceae bacterium]|nr:hypothetical protein [Sandaracinaceae bacterium]
MHRLVLFLFVSSSFVLGCAPPTSGPRRDSGTGGGRDGGSTMSGDDGGGTTTRRDSGRPSFEECTRDVTQAETRARPVDIIWIIDNSGSMDGEARIVQDNINNFAMAIGASGIDYHVVVMTSMGFVSVPPPLGTDATRFRFANVDVQSNDGLVDLVDNFSAYSDFLRPEAITHFIAVTDDESRAHGLERLPLADGGAPRPRLHLPRHRLAARLHALRSRPLLRPRGRLHGPQRRRGRQRRRVLGARHGHRRPAALHLHGRLVGLVLQPHGGHRRADAPPPAATSCRRLPTA